MHKTTHRTIKMKQVNVKHDSYVDFPVKSNTQKLTHVET